MLKIAIGGMLGKNEIAAVLQNYPDKVSYAIYDDMTAAMKVKTGESDSYLGACNTGGGGALSMAIALLGYQNCVTVASPGTLMEDAEIIRKVREGKKAFGFLPENIRNVVPTIVEAEISLKQA